MAGEKAIEIPHQYRTCFTAADSFRPGKPPSIYPHMHTSMLILERCNYAGPKVL